MQIFGHLDEALPPELVAPARMADITIVASAEELRQIAQFLLASADEMDRLGDAYDHAHLHDHQRGFAAMPGLVVAGSALAQC